MSTVQIELPPKLLWVFSGDARFRGAYGGRGSAKTRSFAKMAALHGLIEAQAGRTGIILCCREFMNSLDDSSMAEVKAAIASEEWLAENYDVGEKYIRTRCGRVSFKFAGLRHNVDSVKSKALVLLCWVDEADPVSEVAWSKLIPTIREDGSEIWVTWNPEVKKSPTDMRFRQNQDDDMRIVEMNYRDNPWFPKVLEIERRRDERDRPDSYSHIWEGDYATVIAGAYYAQEMLAANRDGRITHVPHEPDLLVHTAWDLGVGDSTSIWLFQVTASEIHVIDHYESDGKGADHYVEVLAAFAKQNGYRYGDDFVPHDAKAREWTNKGRTRIETLIELGRKPKLVPLHRIDDGVNAARKALAACWFDAEKCENGVEALRQYRREYDDDLRTFRDKPLHDWSSHTADAFRYLAMAWQEMVPPPPKPEAKRQLAVGPTNTIRLNDIAPLGMSRRSEERI